MTEFLSYSPLMNTGLIIMAGIVFMVRLNDSLKQFQRTLDMMSDRFTELDKRLVRQETICKYRHDDGIDGG